MIIAAWVGIGWLLVTLVTALGSRLSLGHVLPDAAIVVTVFLALKKEPIFVATVALALGYLAGRAALAPVGLHEFAAVSCAVGVYLAGGNIAGSSRLFFILTSGIAAVMYHLCIFALLYVWVGVAAFASIATMVLVPTFAVTSLLAWALYPLLVLIDTRLSTERKEELSWR